MKLNEILNVVTYLINIESGENKDVHPTVFTNVLTKINLEYFYELIQGERYDYLTPFLKIYGEEGIPQILVDVNGIVTIPQEFYKMVSVFYNYVKDGDPQQRIIEIKDEATFDLLKQDPIEYPTMRYPICAVRETDIKIAPKEISYVGCKFYQTPTTPVYAVKVQDGVNVYDEANSVELLWKEPDLVHIIRLVLVDFGFHVSPGAVKGAIEQEKK